MIVQAVDQLAQLRQQRKDEAMATLKHRLRHHVLPYLKDQGNKGWPGLSERDRSEMVNSMWDVLASLNELEGR